VPYGYLIVSTSIQCPIKIHKLHFCTSKLLRPAGLLFPSVPSTFRIKFSKNYQPHYGHSEARRSSNHCSNCQFLYHRKHTVSITNTNHLILFTEIISLSLCCVNHKTHSNTLCDTRKKSVMQRRWYIQLPQRSGKIQSGNLVMRHTQTQKHTHTHTAGFSSWCGR
jgi:hypothetical protein